MSNFTLMIGRGCRKLTLFFALISISGCATGLVGKIVALPDGNAVVGATVRAARQLDDEQSNRPQIATSTKSGRFAFKEIAPGAYNLWVSNEGFMDQEIKDLIVSSKKTKVTIELTRRATITGKVIGPDGEPVAGAEILPENGSAACSSNQDGSFELKYIDPGINRIFAVSAEYASGPVEIDLQPGNNPLDLTVELVDADIQSIDGGLDKSGSEGGNEPLVEDGSQ